MSETELERLREVRRLAMILLDEIENVDAEGEFSEYLHTVDPLAHALHESWGDEPRR